jgi:hypothetical protein
MWEYNGDTWWCLVGETNANFANVENPFNVEAERPATMGVCWRALKNGNPKPTLALLKVRPSTYTTYCLHNTD